MRSLTILSLCFVHITGDELVFLLSNSFALEMLELSSCNEIVSIEIPCLLQRLRCLKVSHCDMLLVIENKAPNISSFKFYFDGKNVELLLGESLRVKEIEISHPCVLHNTRAMLPSSMPNLETLSIYSLDEDFSTPMLPSKFLHLKYLNITVIEWAFVAPYDLFSLVSFLDASPCLETFHLDNTPSLECLTLDTTTGACSDGFCAPCKTTLVDAPKALEAIQTYIAGKIPSTAKLNVLEPCNRCRGVDI
ncbi:unnamed protein product [Alopecurus aequalis]